VHCLIGKNNIIGNKPARDKSTLRTRNNIRQNNLKPICNNFLYDLINHIAKDNRPKFSHKSRILNFRDKSNTSGIYMGIYSTNFKKNTSLHHIPLGAKCPSFVERKRLENYPG
jgi:hypothetical protein